MLSDLWDEYAEILHSSLPSVTWHSVDGMEGTCYSSSNASPNILGKTSPQRQAMLYWSAEGAETLCPLLFIHDS